MLPFFFDNAAKKKIAIFGGEKENLRDFYPKNYPFPSTFVPKLCEWYFIFFTAFGGGENFSLRYASPLPEPSKLPPPLPEGQNPAPPSAEGYFAHL